jgi:hypothetical protein
LTSGTVFNQLSGTTLHLGGFYTLFFAMDANSVLTVNSNNGTDPTPIIVDPGEKVSGSGGLIINGGGTAYFSKNSTPIVHTMQSLVINGNGQADLTNNPIRINYGAAPTPATTIQSYIVSGYQGGSWKGPGLVTSLADSSHGLAYADGADGIVQGLTAGSMLVELARFGDANLDGSVGFADLLIVQQYYDQTNTTWDKGDFNYDGSTGSDDLMLLARNYNGKPTPAQFAQLNPDFAAAADAAFASVPEPSCALIPILTCAALLKRRRGASAVSSVTVKISAR